MNGDLTNVTAIVGAVTGTISLVWTVITKIRESGRLLVQAEVSGYVDMRVKPIKRESWLNVRTTNIGKRPVTLVHVTIVSGHEIFSWRRLLGLSMEHTGSFPWYENDMPRELAEGQFYVCQYPLENVDETFLRAEATTSLGRVYSSSVSNNKLVLKRMKQYKEIELKERKQEEAKEA